jgi:hypothetical protein
MVLDQKDAVEAERLGLAHIIDEFAVELAVTRVAAGLRRGAPE